MMMFLLRTNILVSRWGEQTKIVFSDISRQQTFFKHHFNSKKCQATCRWRNVSDILISSSLSWQSNRFFSPQLFFCVCFLPNININYFANSSLYSNFNHCVLSLFIYLPWTSVHLHETKNEYSSNRHSSTQSTYTEKTLTNTLTF